jgi:hypothetical protein
MAAEIRDEFERRMRGDLPSGWREALATMKQATLEEAPKIATRVSSQRVLDTLAEAWPYDKFETQLFIKPPCLGQVCYSNSYVIDAEDFFHNTGSLWFGFVYPMKAASYSFRSQSYPVDAKSLIRESMAYKAALQL